jgi:transposase InsO family protein
MKPVQDLAEQVGKKRACEALNVPRSSFYRIGRPVAPAKPRPRPARALSLEENQEVLDLLHSPRFVDCAPIAVWATLLDEDRYYCSPRTMYRLLEKADEVRERRDQLKHPQYSKPELLAQKPNEVWTWDITELRGPVKYARYYLYVILDLFSRYVTGWMVAEVQSHDLAQHLIEQAVQREGVGASQLTLHSDRGATMLAKPLGLMLSDLGILKSHSRPYCSNDNPFVESHFRTLKYRPQFPDRFGSIVDARVFCRGFFDWYHHQHRHSGLGWMTPAGVHRGQAPDIQQRRQGVLDAAYEKNPQRFVRNAPQAPELPSKVWINPPHKQEEPGQLAQPIAPVLQSLGTDPQTASLNQGLEKRGPQLTGEPFEGDGWYPDTPLNDLQELEINRLNPLFGLELNYENKVSQNR